MKSKNWGTTSQSFIPKEQSKKESSGFLLELAAKITQLEKEVGIRESLQNEGIKSIGVWNIPQKEQPSWK